jgi:dUTP pyrophosphatase
MAITCKITKTHSDAILPVYATEGSSGMDIVAINKTVLLPHEVTKVNTGISISCPKQFEFQIRSRSGLASQGIFVINSPGTIDSDYRGEVCILLMNTNPEPFIVEKGMRIAQMILCPVIKCSWQEDSLDETERGTGGFGSTGLYHVG